MLRMPFSKLQISTFLQIVWVLFFFLMNAIIWKDALNTGIVILASYTFKNQMTDSQTPPSEKGVTISQDKTNN